MDRKIPKRYQGKEVSYCSKCEKWKSYSDFHKDASKANGVSGHCKTCKAEWRAANSEYLIQKSIEWQRNNPERTQANIRKWEAKNSDKVRTYKKKANKKVWEKLKSDPTLANEYREKRKKHPSYFHKRKKKQVISLETAKIKRHKRKARILGSGGTYTEEEWLALCAHYGNRCLCCREVKPLTVDHVKSLSDGGENTIKNIQPLCRTCNSRKGKKFVDYRP